MLDFDLYKNPNYVGIVVDVTDWNKIVLVDARGTVSNLAKLSERICHPRTEEVAE